VKDVVIIRHYMRNTVSLDKGDHIVFTEDVNVLKNVRASCVTAHTIGDVHVIALNRDVQT
jgi:hypothetical protein